VIDFGIARSLRNDGKDAAIEGIRAPGTWRYMSPEQRKPDASGLDTRSDVYSLGVMLYELIVGSNPHAGAPQDAQSDLQPRAPSAELLRLGDAKLAERAAALATTPRELLRALQPDLDAVTQRAMSTDRDGRYASAAELRADLDRFRRHEPVAAAPATWSYLASRFLARHRAITIASALAVASLIGAVLGLGYGALEAKEAEAARANAQTRAMRQLTRAAAQLEFQDLVLFHLDAGVDDTSPSLRSVLDLLAPTISARFGLNALEESGVRTSVGHAYLAVGEPHKALPHLERALELSEIDLESDGAASIALLNDLARASRLAGDADAGSKRLAQMLRVGSRDLRASEPQLAATFASLASLATTAGRDAEFLQSYDRALAAVEAMPRSSESARLVLSLAGLGLHVALEATGRTAETAGAWPEMAAGGWGAEALAPARVLGFVLAFLATAAACALIVAAWRAAVRGALARALMVAVPATALAEMALFGVWLPNTAWVWNTPRIVGVVARDSGRLPSDADFPRIAGVGYQEDSLLWTTRNRLDRLGDAVTGANRAAIEDWCRGNPGGYLLIPRRNVGEFAAYGTVVDELHGAGSRWRSRWGRRSRWRQAWGFDEPYGAAVR
jgi:tetratricopeptide (TPR) repeat protein